MNHEAPISNGPRPEHSDKSKALLSTSANELEQRPYDRKKKKRDNTLIPYSSVRLLLVTLFVFIIVYILSIYQFNQEHIQLNREVWALKSRLSHLENMLNIQADRIIEMNHQFTQDQDELNRLSDELNQLLLAKIDSNIEIDVQSFQTTKQLFENFPATWPVRGNVVSNFGWRQNPMGGDIMERHSGMDIAVPIGTGIVATGGGVVTRATYAGAYGNLVVIDHGMGMETYYGHNSQLLVSVGETVTRGQVIALSGNTGYRADPPHLHYEVRINGSPVNPIDFVTLLDN